MPMLHIYDAGDGMISWVARQRTEARHLLGVRDGELSDALFNLARAGRQFDRILFMTHGGPGSIWFGNGFVRAGWWQAERSNNLHRIAAPGARIYFNGCNVAEGPAGWAFLEAAAELFLTLGGGEAFGQTSVGFASPFSGHVNHFWGRTRRVRVDPATNALTRSES